METKPKLIITGGCGFIFSHVVDFFLKKNWYVIVIDDLSVGSHPELLPDWEKTGNFKFYHMDVSDINVQDLIIREEPDYIIHASAISDVDISIRDPEYVLRQNTLSTINVFEGARHLQNLKKLLYVSTDEVMGECEHRKKEEEILFPRNPYAISKAFGSIMRLGYDNTFLSIKDKTTETRFCNVIGDRQDPRKVLPRIVKSLKENIAMPVQNSGKGMREYIFVENIPPVIELLLEKGDRVYNVTNNDLMSVNELMSKVEEMTGKTIEKTEAHRPGMDTIYQLDNTRIKELGWVPKVSFEEGLHRYLIKEGVL